MGEPRVLTSRSNNQPMLGKNQQGNRIDDESMDVSVTNQVEEDKKSITTVANRSDANISHDQRHLKFSELSSPPKENKIDSSVALSPSRAGLRMASIVNDFIFGGGRATSSVPANEEDQSDEDYYKDDGSVSSMGYSDDSLSLNDAYFRPQPGDNLARPWSRSARFAPGPNMNADGGGEFNYPVNPYQSSSLMTRVSSYGSTSLRMPRESSSNSLAGAFLLGGEPIQEEVEANDFDTPSHIQTSTTQHPQNDSVHSSLSLSGSLADVDKETLALLKHQHHPLNAGKDIQSFSNNKRERRRSRKNHQRQKVQSIRNPKQQHPSHCPQGSLPDQTQENRLLAWRPASGIDRVGWRDSFWAGLFICHLMLVGLCALRYGFGVILFRERWVLSATTAFGSTNVTSAANSSLRENTRRLVERFTTTTVPTAAQTATSIATAQHTNPRNRSHSEKIVSNSLDDDVTTIPLNATLSDILFHSEESSVKTNTDDKTNSSSDNATNTTMYDVTTNNSGTNDLFTIDYKNVLAIIFFAGFYACILSYISFGFMLILARSLIVIMLIFSIIVSLAWGLIGLTADPYGIISVTGFAALLSTLGYTMYSWNRIPFAATNLYTALAAMQSTADITIVGLISLIVAFGWCLMWSTAVIGIVNNYNDKDCDIKDACEAHVNRHHVPLYLFFLLSFHWTTMVIKNVVRVTVASAIGTWWFYPSDIGPFCTSAVVRPLIQSLSTSFGSICLGSLIISPAQLLMSLSKWFCVEGSSSNAPLLAESLSCLDNSKNRPICFGVPDERASSGSEHEDGNAQVVMGVVADTTTTVDSAADTVGICRRLWGCLDPCRKCFRSCNRWAFSYIGMHGYPFFQAGDQALLLFEKRGWMDVVEDNLIQNVLLMASIVIGGSSGVFAVVVEETDGFEFTSFHQPIITAFFIGSVLGYALSNILLLGVVGSAVDTIIVCFAGGPFAFEKSHPWLSREMTEVWSEQLVWKQPPKTRSRGGKHRGSPPVVIA